MASNHLLSLAIELVLEILLSASSSSARTYRSILLVSKQFNNLARFDCLQAVPIVLEGYEQLNSFQYLLEESPETNKHVRYLWITGDGLTCWSLITSILRSCTYVINLSCSSRSVVSLCTSQSFQHIQCTELTLVETWHAWNDIMLTPHGAQLCRQLTHLRLHEGLSPEFPKTHFTHLTHLAFSSRPIREFIERHLETLRPLPALQYVVVTTFWWRDGPPDGSASELLELDRRLAVLHCRKSWTELGTWRDGVSGGFSIWDQAKRERRSMKVFHDVFKAMRT